MLLGLISTLIAVTAIGLPEFSLGYPNLYSTTASSSIEAIVCGVSSLKAQLTRIAWLIVYFTVLLEAIITLYFLGYIRLRTPSLEESVIRSTPSSSEPSSCLSGLSEVDSAPEIRRGPHLWLYECQHDQGTYLCFPPYCAPGGLRDRLFPSHPSVDALGEESGVVGVPLISDFDCQRPSGSIATENRETVPTGKTEDIEVESDQEITFHDPFNIPFPIHHRRKSSKQANTAYLTHNSTNNPLDIFLQTTDEYHFPLHYFIPSFVKQALQDRQHDWNTLGGSHCSLRRELLSIEREQFDLENRDEKFIDEQVGAGKEESETKSKLVSSAQHKTKVEEIKAPGRTENSRFGNYSFEGVRAATQQLVHQAATRSLPWIQVASTKILSAEGISSFASEISPNPPQKTNTADSFFQVQKMSPAQQHTIPLPPSAANASMSNTNANNDEYPNNAAGKPIPQAVLVYHESAHSIVFRDHLRRQQSAIRRTSSEMEHSAHVHSKHPSHHRNHRAGLSRHALPKNSSYPHASRLPAVVQSAPTSVTNTPAASRNVTPAASRSTTPAKSRAASTNSSDTETNDAFQIETDMGYESAGSRGSTHSGRSDGGMSSASSVGSGLYKKNTNGVPLTAMKREKNRQHHHHTHKPPHTSVNPVVIANFQPVIEPLEELNLNSSNVFEPLLDADPYADGEERLEMSEAEKEVAELLKNEQAVVKTIRNADWTPFLQKFIPEEGKSASRIHHPAQCSNSRGTMSEKSNSSDTQYPYNSFVTSTSLLPSRGKKMRCFGSTHEYATGVVFALPQVFPNDESEDAAAKRTKTWSWPSGYSAKTEFNIDHHGNLINGREEALVPLSEMREMNYSYLHHTDYVVGGRIVKGGLQTIPYNEIYIRVGGLGRIVCGVDVVTGKICDDADCSGRSFDNGLGLPVALFIREADYSHIVGLLRTRARIGAIFGRDTAKSMPLFLITPEKGVRVLTEKLQQRVFKTMAWVSFDW